MKKISKLFLSFLFALSALCGLSGCDSMIATSLEGTWEGEMYFASYYDGRYYYSNWSEIEFVGDPFRFKRGNGYWIDYYSGAPWDYVANHFEWEVRNKVIYIHLIEDNYDVEIRDYHLDDDHFSGNVFYEGEDRYFELIHTYSPNWDEYDYGYGYYSQRRAVANDSIGPAASDSVSSNLPPQLKERPKRVLVPAGKTLH